MPEQPDLRVSDHDREQAGAVLSVHYAAGRLNDAELDERLNAVYAARTESDLAMVLSDLPALPAGQLEARAQFAARRADLRRRVLQESGGSLGTFGVCTGVWAFTGGGTFWPALVLIFTLLSLVKNGWALYGPSPNLDKVEAELGKASRERERHAEHQMKVAERHAEHQLKVAERSRQHGDQPGGW
jgi:Domain of unknown function (DUF1707)